MRAMLLLAVVLAACGAHASGGTTTPRRAEATESEISGVTVIARERAGSGHLAAGLFVRVDADPLALATTVALILEERSGGRLVGRATADGVVLRSTAPRAELDDLIGALRTALASRDVTADEVDRALSRVRARRVGRAQDDRARAARLAVAAMFGAELDPLGSAVDDERMTSGAASELLRAQFGAERALVVVVGDAPTSAVESAVAHAFEDAPHVARGEPSAAALQRGARAEVSDHDVVAVARRMIDLDAAERTRSWITWADPTVSVSTFPLRGAAWLIAVRDGDASDGAALIGRIQRAAALDERAGPGAAPDVEGELLGLGDAWLARGPEPQGDGLGIGLVVAASDGPPEADDARAERLRSQLLAAATETGTATGVLDEATADQRLSSGIRVRVRRVSGAPLAVAIAFDGGAVLDPRVEHGRAALVSALVGRSCEPDADLTWVDARSMGFVVSGETGTLARTIARAVDCVRRAGREVAHADGLRAEAIAQLDDGARARAWAASAIAPGSPGLVAPRGSAAGLAAVSNLEAAVSSMLRPSRATLVIVGDVDPAEAVEIADALASELAPQDESPRAPAGGPATSDVFLADPVVVAPQVIVTLRSDVGESAAAARATARALADALAAEGAAVRFWFGDAALGSSFVAVGVGGDDALLDALPARLSARFAALDPRSGLEETIEAEARRHALGSPVEIARDMASGVEGGDPLAVVAGLLSATPRYVMLRPSASPMHPPRRR